MGRNGFKNAGLSQCGRRSCVGSEGWLFCAGQVRQGLP